MNKHSLLFRANKENKMKTPILAVVVPSYNEALVLEQTGDKLINVLKKMAGGSLIDPKSYVFFVDDGSSDGTWDVIAALHRRCTSVRGIRLTRNFGHQNALYAGLIFIRKTVDCAVTIDADLQQDEEAIAEFIKKYLQGYDVVLGTREDRSSDGWFKKCSAFLFYRLMRAMGVRLIQNQADYRLLSRKALDFLSEYSETNLFLRGLIPTLGLRTAVLCHKVRERTHGKSKYGFWRMFSFAVDGITSFSIFPLRLIAILGCFIFFFSMVMSIYVFIERFRGHVIIGWASTLIPIYLIGGIQLMSLGIVGEYIGKIYFETKRRPRYLIETELPSEGE